MTPMTTWTCMAVLPAKLSTQGEIKTQTPTIRLSHSSQTANAANAAIDITAMTIPLTTAFCEAAPLGKPKIQGATKRIPPRTRLATSQSLALLHSFMTSSFLYPRPPPALIALTAASQTDEIFDGRRSAFSTERNRACETDPDRATTSRACQRRHLHGFGRSHAREYRVDQSYA